MIVVEEAFQTAVAWKRDPARPDAAAPGVGIAASAGLGKTEAVLEAIVGHGAALLRKGHVVFQFPTLELADQAHQRFLAMGSRLPSLVLRGRVAADPDVKGRQMCERAELVAAAQGYLPAIGGGFCKTEKPDGTVVTAPCYASCRYYAQFWGLSHSVIFTSHGYLGMPLPAKGQVSLRIIDESFWKSLCHASSLGLDLWLAGPKPPSKRPKLQRLDAARRIAFVARSDGRPLCAELRVIGIDVDQLKAFAEFEMEGVTRLNLRPDLPEAEQRRRIAAFDAAAWQTARRRAGIWRLLADNLHLDDTERLVLDADARCSKTGAARAVLIRHTLRPLALDEPTIVIDADLDPMIMEACLPGLAIHRIEAEPQAEVLQLVDRTLSNAFLLTHQNAEAHRRTVLDLVEDEVWQANGGGVLVVAPKKVLEALHDDEGTAGSGHERLREPLRGAAVRWFGDSLLRVERQP